MAEPFIAEVRIWAGDFAPRGWAFCNGAALSQASHMVLFSLIGTQFGSAGPNQFNLPDFQGKAPMGAGTGTGLTTRIEGESGGAAGVALTTPQMGMHSHVMQGNQKKGDAGAPATDKYLAVDVGAGGTENIRYMGTGRADTTMAGEAVGLTGTGAAHENRQPNLALSFCIALDGLYPRRS